VAEPGETAVHQAEYVILSLSGDIYYIGQDLVQTTIPGTQTEDPEGEETYSYGFVWTGTEYLVAGEWGFLRAGLGRDWRDEAPEIPEQYPYGQPSWRVLGTDRSGTIYIAAYRRANPRHFNFYPGHPEYRDGLSEDEIWEKTKALRDEQDSYPQLLKLYAGKPGAWQEIPLPDHIAGSTAAQQYTYVSSVVPKNDDTCFILGSDGLILEGSPASGFKVVSSLVDRQYHLNAGTWYRGELVVSAHGTLLRFDGHLLSPFLPKPKVNNPPYFPQTAALHATDGNLFLFDFTMRYRVFDGERWQNVEIPDALQERPFKGLYPKQ
jgi:hypothetical protein